MQINITAIGKSISRYPGAIVLIGILLYIGTFCAFSAVKLDTYGYNAVDLGIYTNVAWHTAHGDLFGMTIHPQSYLEGDHLEIAFLPVALLYNMFSSPLTLLVLQSIVLGCTAWPIFLLARRRMKPMLAVLIAWVYLLNPFVQNTNAFEFHMLSFAILPLAWALVAYERKKILSFLVLLLLAMTVREDVSLVVIGLGALAWADRRSWSWRLIPIIGGLSWFFSSIYFIAQMNPDGVYKFLSYYPLGDASVPLLGRLGTITIGVLGRLVSFESAILLIALMIPFMALPLIVPRRMIPAILVLFQLLLTGFTELVLKTHYGILLIPILFYAMIAALERLRTRPPHFLKKVDRAYQLALTLLVAATFYSTLTFGPLPAFTNKLIIPSHKGEETQTALRSVLKNISPDDAIISSFAPLPDVAGREKVYSLHYAFLGTRQYSDAPYEIPADADTLIIDFRDLLIYELQSETITPYMNARDSGPRKIRELIQNNKLGLVEIHDTVARYTAHDDNQVVLIDFPNSLPDNLSDSPRDLGPITYLGSAPIKQGGVSFFWKSNGTLIDRYQLEVRWTDSSGVVTQKLFPLAYGLYPTTEWMPGDLIQTNYWFSAPPGESDQRMEIMLTKIDGYMSLDGMRSAVMRITSDVPLARDWIVVE